MPAKKMSTKAEAKTHASISMTINGAEFYAEGTQEEVSAKLDEFLATALAPVRKFAELVRKGD